MLCVPQNQSINTHTQRWSGSPARQGMHACVRVVCVRMPVCLKERVWGGPWRRRDWRLPTCGARACAASCGHNACLTRSAAQRTPGPHTQLPVHLMATHHTRCQARPRLAASVSLSLVGPCVCGTGPRVPAGCYVSARWRGTDCCAAAGASRPRGRTHLPCLPCWQRRCARACFL